MCVDCELAVLAQKSIILNEPDFQSDACLKKKNNLSLLGGHERCGYFKMLVTMEFPSIVLLEYVLL